MPSDTLGYKSFDIPTPALILSLLIHCTAPILYLIFQALDARNIRIFPKPETPKSVVTPDFIQVDVVALPDELISDSKLVNPTQPVAKKKPAKAKPKPKPKPKKSKSSMKLKVRNKKQVARQQAKEREEALKKLQRDLEKKKALEALAETTGKRVRLKGNILAKGTSTSGSRGSPSDIYSSLVKQAIGQHFEVYRWQLKKGLEAIISIEIGPDGKVKSTRFVKRSRERRFDVALIKALEKAQPLPVPEDISILRQKFEITFRPEDSQ